MAHRNVRSSEPTIDAAIPAARAVDLVVTDIGEELVVYDKRSHQIHHLNPTAAAIWRLCDGRRPLSAVQRMSNARLGEPLSEELVRDAIAKLARARLLDEQPQDVKVERRSSRRSLVRNAALTGAGLVTAQIVSVTAPAAAAVESGWVSNCLEYGDDSLLGRRCSFDLGKTFGVCTQDGTEWWTIQCK